MQEGENLTREQIEDEIKKIKEAHAEDEGMSLYPFEEIVHAVANCNIVNKF